VGEENDQAVFILVIVEKHRNLMGYEVVVGWILESFYVCSGMNHMI
jgi:hypothetical protein